ncbi:hypothetical protein CCACVL1_16120 [Corchorus capsularis]|uniref:Uncharacterized protein n=1 Tax=Corchorus capsularis TaxID=210143 RepID=A0A1R3HZ51_COCAP|nr:hypothetical protein CCACVL1_16120 [Corchorus capsularis]
MAVAAMKTLANNIHDLPLHMISNYNVANVDLNVLLRGNDKVSLGPHTTRSMFSVGNSASRLTIFNSSKAS